MGLKHSKQRKPTTRRRKVCSAWELYDDAISSGQRAYIVQETEESPDVFSMVVGCLPPKESVFVTLVYVTELTVDADHGLRFCLPAVLNPRYTPSNMGKLGIHRLAARALIQSLEMEEKKTYAREKATIDQSLRDKVVDLSVQSGVSSSFTAFLVVHKGSGHPVTGPMVDKRRVYNLRDFTLADEPVKYEDPYMKLLSLQKAAGYWNIDSKLLSVFGKTENELIQKRPAQVDNAVWVTIVALIWLHSFKKPEQEEWKFIAIKATSWIRSRKVGKLSECIQAGKALLESEAKEESLGL